MSAHRDTLRALTEARPARLTPDSPTPDPLGLTAYPQENARTRKPTRRLVLAGVGLAAAAAVGVAVLPPGTMSTPRVTATGSQTATKEPQTAADFLLVAAEATGTAPAESGRYWVYRVEEGVEGHAPLTIEQRLATVDGLPSAGYFRDADGSWSLRKMQGHTASNNFLLAGQTRSAAELAALPSQPDLLKEQLIKWYNGTDRLEGNQTEFFFYAVSALAMDLPVRPEVRAAAYKLLAGVPGITSLGRVTDATGRRGIAVAFVHHGDGGGTVQVRLIIDPATGSALAQEYWIDGARDHYTAVLSAEWSDSDLPAAADIR
jgi:hypothetical protein